MQDKKSHNVILITDVLMNHFKCDEQKELDRLLGVREGSVASWRNRDSIPLKHHEHIITKCKIDRTWFRTGEGEPFPQPKPAVADPGIAYHDDDPRLTEIRQLWGSICHQQRDALLAVAQGFAKQPPETSPENEEKVIDLYGKRSA